MTGCAGHLVGRAARGDQAEKREDDGQANDDQLGAQFRGVKTPEIAAHSQGRQRKRAGHQSSTKIRVKSHFQASTAVGTPVSVCPCTRGRRSRRDSTVSVYPPPPASPNGMTSQTPKRRPRPGNHLRQPHQPATRIVITRPTQDVLPPSLKPHEPLRPESNPRGQLGRSGMDHGADQGNPDLRIPGDR